MSASATVERIIDEYITSCNALIANAKPTDGLLGLGRDPGSDKCHDAFFEALERATAEMAAEPISAEEAYDAVLLLFRALKERSCPDMARWSLAAAHKAALPLIPLLRDGQREQLRQWYDDRIPRRERLPIQKAVYKALCK